MPTYDFKCTACGTIEEHIYSMSEVPDKIKCKCGKEMMRQIGAGSYFIIKGESMKTKSTHPWYPPERRMGRDHGQMAEDMEIKRKADKARALKASGKVPQHEIIGLEDKCLRE